MGKINNFPNHQPVIHKLLQIPAAQDIHGDARFGHLALHWEEPGGLTCWDAEDADAGYSPIGKSSIVRWASSLTNSTSMSPKNCWGRHEVIIAQFVTFVKRSDMAMDSPPFVDDLL